MSLNWRSGCRQKRSATRILHTDRKSAARTRIIHENRFVQIHIRELQQFFHVALLRRQHPTTDSLFVQHPSKKCRAKNGTHTSRL